MSFEDTLNIRSLHTLCSIRRHGSAQRQQKARKLKKHQHHDEPCSPRPPCTKHYTNSLRRAHTNQKAHFKDQPKPIQPVSRISTHRPLASCCSKPYPTIQAVSQIAMISNMKINTTSARQQTTPALSKKYNSCAIYLWPNSENLLGAKCLEHHLPLQSTNNPSTQSSATTLQTPQHDHQSHPHHNPPSPTPPTDLPKHRPLS